MSARALSPGERFADYVVVRLIGAGGFGAVYEAEHAITGRRAALKIAHPHVAEDDDSRARALQEARALGELSHPHIVALQNAGITDDGRVWIATELLSGWTLRELRGRSPRPMPVEQATAILADVCEGVAAAHDIQIIHRDLKPENVFVTRQMRVVVLDFTAAKATGRNLVQSTGETAGPEGGRRVLGTPAYMSPEQVRGERVDHRTDMYSLGVMAYELLWAHPFSDEDGSLPDEFEIARRHDRTKPVPLTERISDFPEDLWVLIERLLSKRRDERPSRMLDVATELRAIRRRYMGGRTSPMFTREWRGAGSFAVSGEARARTAEEGEPRHPSRSVVVRGHETHGGVSQPGRRTDAAEAAPTAHVIHITADRKTRSRKRRIDRRVVTAAVAAVAFMLVLVSLAWLGATSRSAGTSAPAPDAGGPNR